MKVYLLYFVLYFATPDLVSGLSLFCTKTEDCPKFATCQNGLCVCDVGKVSSSNGNECLDLASGIGSPCKDTSQCMALISGPAVCNEREFCSCNSGYVYLNNECVRYMSLNDPCGDDTPCYDGVDLFALKCGSDRKCECNDGYYMRGGMDCRKSAKVDGKCFFDIDCENENQYCKFIYGPLGDCRNASNIECTTNQDCKNLLNNSTCADYRQNKCTCDDGFFYDIENNMCISENSEEPELEPKPEDNQMEKYIPGLKIKVKPGLDQPCTDDAGCKVIQNSFCPKFRNKCTCLNGFVYYKNSGNCIRGLGSTCLKSADIKEGFKDPECEVKYSFCNEQNVCQCPKYFIYSPYNNKCFKPTRKINLHSCASDENCFSFGLHTTCTKVASTDISTCTCNSNSKYDEELQYCKPTSMATGCKNECKSKLHSKCIAGECKCEENYVEQNLQCFPDLGYPCSLANGDDCVIENAKCVEDTKICQCEDGYFKNGNRECLKVVEDIEEKCVSDIQCFKLLNEGGICLNETCTCSTTHVHDDKLKKCQLIRHIGDQCSTKHECQTMLNSDNVICLNGACTCDYDYHLSDDNTKCVADNGASSLDGRQLIFILVLIVTTLLFFL